MFSVIDLIRLNNVSITAKGLPIKSCSIRIFEPCFEFSFWSHFDLCDIMRRGTQISAFLFFCFLFVLPETCFWPARASALLPFVNLTWTFNISPISTPSVLHTFILIFRVFLLLFPSLPGTFSIALVYTLLFRFLSVSFAFSLHI